MRRLMPSVKIVLIGISCVIAILVYPFQTIVVPEWKLHVIDDLGKSVSGIRVTQHWQHNSLESEGHEDLKTTDAEGQVAYPARTIRASLITRALAIPAKAMKEGHEAKFGVYASVVVWGSNAHDTNVAIFESGELPPAEIVVPRIP